MRSAKAKKERAALVAAFIQAHCMKGLPGTQPFFRSLYTLLRLQGLKASKGGAGKRRAEWEIDTAVFSEAGGGTWMQDSIDVLKSVSSLLLSRGKGGRELIISCFRFWDARNRLRRRLPNHTSTTTRTTKTTKTEMSRFLPSIQLKLATTRRKRRNPSSLILKSFFPVQPSLSAQPLHHPP